MKKITFLLILILSTNLSVMADELLVNETINTNKTALINHKTIIEDEVVKSHAFPKIIPNFVKPSEPIVDELIVPYEQTDGTLKLWVRKDVERNLNIDDELITQKFRAKFGGKSLTSKRKITIDDKLAQLAPIHKVRRIKVKNKYDFTKPQIPVQLKVLKPVSTKHKIKEGDEILFATTKDVVINDEYLPKGTEVIGRIETISRSDKMGTPANIIVDNFYVKDKPELSLYGNVTKTGANRSIWVYPLYQAGNIMFYVAGFAFVPIHGGHAKILTNDTFTVYYELN